MTRVALALFALLASGSIHLRANADPPEPALVVTVDSDGWLRLFEREADRSERDLVRTSRNLRWGGFPELGEGRVAYSRTKSMLEVDVASDVPWVSMRTILPTLLDFEGIAEVRFVLPGAEPLDWPVEAGARAATSKTLTVRLQRGGSTRVIARWPGERLFAMPFSDSPDAVPGQDPFVELDALLAADLDTGVLLEIDDFVPVHDVAGMLGFLAAAAPRRVDFTISRTTRR